MRLLIKFFIIATVTFVRGDENEEKPPDDYHYTIPHAITMEDFRNHVLGFQMKEVFWKHPANTTDNFWFGVRLYITAPSPKVIYVRKTGDEPLENGDVKCRNVTEIYYNANDTSAEFMNQGRTYADLSSWNSVGDITDSEFTNLFILKFMKDKRSFGYRYVFASDEPHRYIYGFLCRKWKPGARFCHVQDSYASLYLKGDEDIEYYDEDEDKMESLDRQKRGTEFGRYFQNAVGGDVREQFDPGFTERNLDFCKYDDDE